MTLILKIDPVNPESDLISQAVAVLKDGVHGGHRFVFYASDVRPYGVINLHRARVSWLRRALEAERLLAVDTAVERDRRAGAR